MHANRMKIEKRIKDWGANSELGGAGIRKVELGLGTTLGRASAHYH